MVTFSKIHFVPSIILLVVSEVLSTINWATSNNVPVSGILQSLLWAVIRLKENGTLFLQYQQEKRRMKAEMISFYTKCRTDPRYVQAIQQIETTLDDPKVQQAVKDALDKQGNSQEGGYVA